MMYNHKIESSFEVRRTINVVTMANFGFECPLYYNALQTRIALSRSGKVRRS